MLQIPFINKLIDRALKRQIAADDIDFLNYCVSTYMLTFFSILISAKQYFGSPIQCWVPNEFKGGWEKYAEDYCFIANSYHIPFEEELPAHGSEARQDHISYYRWVPIMLAVQAVFFYLPNFFWNVLHKQTAINPKSFLVETAKITGMHGDDRDRELSAVANEFMDSVSVFGSADYKRRLARPRSGYNAALLYLLVKAMYVGNILFQIFLLNQFLGENFLNWGYNVTTELLSGHEWKESPVFPRIIMCDFEIRRLGNRQNHTVQCVIMLNMINEKLYLWLFYWFTALAIANIMNFFYYCTILLIPQFRTRMVMIRMDGGRKNGHYRRRDVDRFVKECLHPDGVLLLMFLKEHCSGRVTYELGNKLLALYTAQESFSDDSIEKHPHSPLLQKYSAPPNYQNFNEKQPLYPGSITNRAFEAPTAPSKDYTDCGTMRIGEKPGSSSPGREARSSPTDV